MNRCDYFGRTALHHASGNGHVGCVVFLVAFGVNIWSLDNNFNTPLDVAAIHNRTPVVNYLDKAAADQMTSNVRAFKKQRESAIRDAERRAKHFQKSPQEMEVAGAEGMKLTSSRGFPSSYPDSAERPGTSPSYVSLTLSSRLSGRTAVSELRPYSSHFEHGSQQNVGADISYPSHFENDSPPYAKSGSLLSLLAKKLQRKQPRPHAGSASGNNSTVDSMQMERSSRKPVGSLFGVPSNGGTDPIQETEETIDIERVRPSTPFRAYSQTELTVHQGIHNFGMDELDATYITTTRQGIEQQHPVRDKDPSALAIKPSLGSELAHAARPNHENGYLSSHGHRAEGNGSDTAVVNDNTRRSHEEITTRYGSDNDREKLHGATSRFSASNNRKRLGIADGERRTQNGSSNNREGSGSVERDYKLETEWFNNRERFDGLNGRSVAKNLYSNNPEKDEFRSISGNGWMNDSVISGKTGSASRTVDRRGSALDAFLQAYGLLDYVPVLAREKLDMNSLTLVTDLDLKDLGIPLGPRRVLLDAVARRRTTLGNPGRIIDSTF